LHGKCWIGWRIELHDQAIEQARPPVLAKHRLADVARQCGINFLSVRDFIASWANGFDIDH
jgi:hypothetical protein